MYCSQCGAEINDRAVICVKCGCPIDHAAFDVRRPRKTMSNEWLMAILLCVFLGCLGVHRFYTKSPVIGAAQLVVGIFSCCIISELWALIDLLLILTGCYKTGDGRTLSQN